MSRREKIIVSIMVATVLLGGYVYWGPSEPRPQAVGAQNKAQQAMQFAREVIQKLKAEDADAIAKELFSMRSAERAWQKDPFVNSTMALSDKPQPKRLENEPIAEDHSTDMVYTGYIEAGSQRLAIINGIEYATGESINAQGYYVRRIQPHQVDIGKHDAADMIILKYTESGLAASH